MTASHKRGAEGRSVVFMYSGQGSQMYGMGRLLYDENERFREELDRLDRMAMEIAGYSVLEELYNPDRGRGLFFDRLKYTHPAIFMIEHALTLTLEAEGIVPDCVLGTSMGEFAAMAASGVLAGRQALEALFRQVESFEKYCDESGSMLAIMSDITEYDRNSSLRSGTELAGTNYGEHYVLAGKLGRLQEIEAELKSENKLCQMLPVTRAFHSAEIDSARESYLTYLNSLTFSRPRVKVISAERADFIEEIPVSYLWDVVRNPIRFKETIEKLESRGSYIYLDIGPSGTLSTFVNRNLSEDSNSQSFAIITPFRQELKNLEKVKKYFIDNKLVKKNEEECTMTTYVFPGQGSQKKGMGEGLFDKYSELTAKADAILGYSIKELCLEDPDKVLGQTEYTQPALFIVNALTYLDEVEKAGRKPDYVAGHSLGEYAALFAAGLFDFETGVKLVQKRGALMSRASGGGMAAVIGLEDDEVERVIRENSFSSIDVANFNSPGQIVISGPKDDIMAAQEAFVSGGAKMYIPLKVSGAFHSRYMQESRDSFAAFLEDFEFNELQIPVISNFEARPYSREKSKELLASQITGSVRWTESIRYLMGKGGEEFKEIGPGNVLTKMVNKIFKESSPLVIEDEAAAVPVAAGAVVHGLTAEKLGSSEFKKDYGLKYAYTTGAMVRGIASKEMVIKMARAGMIGFLGTGGMSLKAVEEDINYIQEQLKGGEAYGMNLLNNLNEPEVEEATVDLYLKYGIINVEAAAYMQVSPALVRYRIKGLSQGADGRVKIAHRVIAKVSRPEVAASFLSPAPERILKKLLEAGKISEAEAEMSRQVPMADDICVEADSGGHTDMGVAYTLMPAMRKLRDEMMARHNYVKRVRVGAAGGIGTPESAAAAFILGADFITTGSINQCTVEAGTSEAVKELLQAINVQDTDYAPAGDMFEIGARVQVLRKGVFFPARANKLYDLYSRYNSLDEIDEKTRKQVQEKYFKRTFEDIWQGTKEYFMQRNPKEIEKAERNPKHKMALVFRWYFFYATEAARTGDPALKVDYQVHCGPSLGAFNQWVKGTPLEEWRNRHVDEIALKLMRETASFLNNRFSEMAK